MDRVRSRRLGALRVRVAARDARAARDGPRVVIRRHSSALGRTTGDARERVSRARTGDVHGDRGRPARSRGAQCPWRPPRDLQHGAAHRLVSRWELPYRCARSWRSRGLCGDDRGVSGIHTYAGERPVHASGGQRISGTPSRGPLVPVRGALGRGSKRGIRATCGARGLGRPRARPGRARAPEICCARGERDGLNSTIVLPPLLHESSDRRGDRLQHA